MKEYLKLMDEIVEHQEPIRELITTTKIVLRSFAPEVKDILEEFLDYVVDCNARCIKRLVEKHEFTREEAINIVGNISKQINKK